MRQSSFGGVAAFCLVGACALSACGASTQASVEGGYTPGMRAAVAAATRIATDLTTFDYRHLDAHYARMKSEATTAFATTLNATRADIVAFDERAKVISQGSVLASAAKPVASDGTVTVLLFVDQRLHRANATVGQLEQARVQLVMKSVGGRWLVDQATVTGSS